MNKSVDDIIAKMITAYFLVPSNCDRLMQRLCKVAEKMLGRLGVEFGKNKIENLNFC